MHNLSFVFLREPKRDDDKERDVKRKQVLEYLN